MPGTILTILRTKINSLVADYLIQKRSGHIRLPVANGLLRIKNQIGVLQIGVLLQNWENICGNQEIFEFGQYFLETLKETWMNLAMNWW